VRLDVAVDDAVAVVMMAENLPCMSIATGTGVGPLR
jgi:hypothetical protein